MAYTYIVEPLPSAGPISRELLFITEGIDDALFLEALLIAKKADAGRVEIRHVQGIGNIPNYLKGVTLSPNFTQGRLKGICVIVDADDSFEKTEKTYLEEFRINNLPIKAAGSVEASGGIALGLYILPKNGTAGMLEDLIIDSVRNDMRTELAETAIQSRIDDGIKLDKLGKRKLQIFLALSEGVISKGPGRGIRNGTIPFDHLHFVELNDFLDSFLLQR